MKKESVILRVSTLPKVAADITGAKLIIEAVREDDAAQRIKSDLTVAFPELKELEIDDRNHGYSGYTGKLTDVELVEVFKRNGFRAEVVEEIVLSE